MSTTYYSIITNNGLIKNAQASVNNVSLDLVELAVGDSNGVDYDPDPTDTALQNELHRTNLTHVAIDENNPNQLIIEGIIDEEIGPFFVREIGIFDSDGDLFALGKFPETFKPNLPSGVGKKLYVRMILGFANAPNATLISANINTDPNFSTNVNEALSGLNQDISNINDDISSINSSINLINSVPAGSIFAIPSINIPSDYLECNGAEISRTTYSNLFDVIGTNFGSGDGSATFNLPDLRGEFIRGWDNGRGIDNGRVFASSQSGSIESHNHSITLSMRTGGVVGGYNGPHWSSEHIHHGFGTANTTNFGGSETRPRNIALIYCIKY